MKNNKTYRTYTILFCAISFIVFAIFIKYHKSFVWQADGIKQHFVFLYDFHQIINKMFQDGFPMLSWNMGLGLDVIGQYSYYVVGDPFAYFSLLFPLEHLEVTYNILVILRMYCVGLAFIAYCQYQKKEKVPTLLGAISYTFCGFVLYAGIRHPYFTNALIFLPLNLIGVEKLLKENKKVFFIFIIFVSVLNNYYFFYMITIITVLYGLVKYILEYHQDGKHFFRKLGSAVLCYMIGLAMAGIVLLPTIYAFLNSARTQSEQVSSYIPGFYKFFFSGLISMRFKNWTVIAISSIILLMLPILVTKTKDKEAKSFLILLIITSLMLLIPQVASAMNGFSYPSNRWVFAYSFILAYIITICYDTKLSYSKKQKIAMFLALVVYSIIGVWITKLNIKSNLDYYAAILIAFLMFLVMSFSYQKPKNMVKANLMIVFFVIMSIAVNALALYSTKGKGYVEEFIENGKVEEKCATANNTIENYKEAIDYLKTNDKDFYRIAKKDISYQNLSLLYDYNPIQLFLSLGNKYVYGLSKDLEDNQYASTRCVNGADRRTQYTTLLATKYYICDQKDLNYVPYGYKLYQQIGNTQIYMNENFLSPGIIYNNYITKEEFDQLSPLEKADSLLTTAMVEEEITTMQKGKVNIDKAFKLKYTMENINENGIKTTKKNESIKLKIDKIIPNTEIYLSIQNLQYQSCTEKTNFTLTANLNHIRNSESVDDMISSAYYMKNPDFLMNLGIGKESKPGKLTITLNNKGTYTWDSLEILAVPMDRYENKINDLRKNQMQNVEYGNNYMAGTVNLEQNGILQIATSYSDGWKAFIDGKEAKVVRVNEAFVGAVVEGGEHTVRFEYTTPFLKTGLALSLIGITAYIVIIIIDRKTSKMG